MSGDGSRQLWVGRLPVNPVIQYKGDLRPVAPSERSKEGKSKFMIRSAKAFALVGAFVAVSFAQTTPTPDQTPVATAEGNHAAAYYNFAMGQVYSMMAQSEGNQDDALKAIQYYKDALKADPNASETYGDLTDLYLALSRPADAIALAQEMLKQNPDNVAAHRMLGRIYFSEINKGGQDQIDERALHLALQEFQTVTAKDPKDVESLVTLGRLYAGSNDTANAEKAYNAALAVEPDNDEALTGLALVYGNMGDTAKAIEKLKAASDKSPSPRTLMILAQAYENQMNYKDAAGALRKALELQPDNDRLARSLAEDLFFSDQYDEALKIYTDLAAHNPKDPSFPVRMADIYRAQHNYAKAHEEIDQAKKIDPDGLEPRLAEVQLFEMENKPDQAIHGLQSVLDDTARKIYSKDEQQQRAAWFEELGKLNVAAKHYPEAVAAFQQMSVSKDNGPLIAAHVVETYVAGNDLASAQREADEALKKFPDEYMVVRVHADVLSDLGKTDAAVKELRALLNGPRDRDTFIAIAEIDQKAKRYADAESAVDDAEKLSTTDEEKEDIYFMRGALMERQKK